MWYYIWTSASLLNTVFIRNYLTFQIISSILCAPYTEVTGTHKSVMEAKHLENSTTKYFESNMTGAVTTPNDMNRHNAHGTGGPKENSHGVIMQTTTNVKQSITNHSTVRSSTAMPMLNTHSYITNSISHSNRHTYGNFTVSVTPVDGILTGK